MSIAMRWAEKSAMDFFNESHVGRSHSASTRAPFERIFAHATTVATMPRLAAMLKCAQVEPGPDVEVDLCHDVVFMGRIIESGDTQVTSPPNYPASPTLIRPRPPARLGRELSPSPD